MPMTATPVRRAPTTRTCPSGATTGYDVTGYELDLDYRVDLQPARGPGADHGRGHRSDLSRLTLDLVGLRVREGGGRRSPGRAGRTAAASSRSRRRRPSTTAPPSPSTSATPATPRPRRSTWGAGRVGRSSTDGVLVASQPSGAPTWFPCNDLPEPEGAVPDRGHRGVGLPRGGQRPLGSGRVRGSQHDLGVRAGRADGAVPGDAADRALRGARRGRIAGRDPAPCSRPTRVRRLRAWPSLARPR